MKKFFIVIILILLILIASIVGINIKSKSQRVIKIENEEYEKYLNTDIYGTDVITLINKATNSNEANKISKDEKQNYINNDINSIEIEVEFITNEEKRETTTYKMEQINYLGTSEFIKNFNSAKFRCTDKKYHSQTGKISYLKFSQQYE